MSVVRGVVFVLGACGTPRAAAPTSDVTNPPPRDAGVAVSPHLAPTTIEVVPAPPHDSTVANGNVGTWREGETPPRTTTKPLAVHDESAPGRTDSAGQIAGYCPPRARVFDLGADRALVTREPCSGVTEISLRERANDRVRERRVADSLLYGVVGTWRVVPLDRDRLVMISQSTTTNLQLVDLSTTRARWIRMPVGLERAHGLEVGVLEGKIYIWGGSLEQTIGETGCENPQPGRACDPAPVTKLAPHRKVWIWSLQ